MKKILLLLFLLNFISISLQAGEESTEANATAENIAYAAGALCGAGAVRDGALSWGIRRKEVADFGKRFFPQITKKLLKNGLPKARGALLAHGAFNAKL